MTSRKTRILLVDDHPLVRRALADLIDEESDLEVCGEAGNLAEASEHLRGTCPDLAIVDISLDGGSGLEFVKKLRIERPSVAAIMFSMHDERVYAERSIRAGARGYVMKRESSRRIIAAIREVLAGKLAISDVMNELFAFKFLRGQVPVETSPLECLSDRELEIFELLGSGNDTRIIADLLRINIKTVQTYCARIKEKLCLESASELMVAAIRWKETHSSL